MSGQSRQVESAMRAAIYARYSSDLQRDASINDQVRICRRRLDQENWHLAQVYSDHGASGASLLRPGYQKLLQDAREGLFDVLVAESIDRLSRDQEHIASLYKMLSFRRIPFVTVAEGEISELHIGLKGTMSALYLKDLAQKTHRGLEGRVRQGRSAGGVSYGYDLVRTIRADGQLTTGERIIKPTEASVVRRVFREFAAGRSPRAIAAGLNSEKVPGPRSSAWGASTIYGNWRRGTGLLNNELYIGRMIWNRQRFVKDPQTGRRQARPNPPEAWIIEGVPNLRIIDDELWAKVKTRQETARSEIVTTDAVRAERARRPKYLFSGLIKCGACGGGYVLVGKSHYGCANVRNRGTCDNRLTIRRDRLEQAILSGLREKLLHPDLLAAFVAEYQKEWNRLRREDELLRNRDAVALGKVERQIGNIITAVKEGLFAPSMKEELAILEERKAALIRSMADAPEEMPRLHPALAGVYQKKVADLTQALNDDELRTQAAASMRGLLEEIRLIPQDGDLVIELVGELAGLLTLGNEKSPRDHLTGASLPTLVAGTGFEPVTFRL
jgi:site-specific DNA recombinase